MDKTPLTNRSDLAEQPMTIRTQTVLEETINAVTHGLGAFMAVAVAAVLITFASLEGDPLKIVGLSVYGASLFILYLASTLYHGIQHEKAKRILNIFDHCSIYLLIAGTYTPFLLVTLNGPTGWTLLWVVWSLGLTGIFFKVARPRRYERAHLINYVVMGWIIVFAGQELTTQFSPSGLAMLVAGGLSYSIGVIFFLLDRHPFLHAIWHLFVLGGSICHCIAIFLDVL